MVRFSAAFGVGVFAGYLLGIVIPPRVFMIACLVLLALMVLMFLLFHLGLRDFQEY